MSARDLEFQLAFGRVATLVKLIGLVPARNFITLLVFGRVATLVKLICRVSARDLCNFNWLLVVWRPQ